MLKEITIAVLGAAVIGMFGYILKIEKNISGIDELNLKMDRVTEANQELEETIIATKLTIVKNHPNIDLTLLASTSKLKDMTKSEVESISGVLRASMDEKSGAAVFTVSEGSGIDPSIRDKYNLTDLDLEVYHNIVAFGPRAIEDSRAN